MLAVLSGGPKQKRQPPPPAPHTLAAAAPAPCARAINGRQPLAVLPFLGDGPSGGVPIALHQSGAHGGRGVANPLEAVEDVGVAVDVTLGDLPVVGTRKMRFAGVAQHDPAVQLLQVHVERDAMDAVTLQLEGSQPAVQRWTVVLQAGGHPDGLRLDVHRHLQQRLGLVVLALPFGECRAHGDVQRRRPRQPGPRRRLGSGGQCDAARAEESRQQRQQAQARLVPQRRRVVGLHRDAGVFGPQHDACVGPRLEPGSRADADGGIDRLRAGVEEV
jgi:hypothetical protein